MKTSSEATFLIKILDFSDALAIKYCASLMSRSEPWITLGRDYEASIQTLSDENKEIYLAYIDNQIAGFIILNLQGAFVGYIQTVCVSPEERGKGFGSKLIAFAEERIFREFPNIFICVSSFNTRVQKLYQKLGYEIVGELKNYIIVGHAEILLRKTISPIGKFNRYP